jgi:5'-phosphate synthase pdxT subunit
VKIGVLALQGDFLEHRQALERLNIAVAEVRQPHDLVDLDGLIVPGGESTTIGKLAAQYGLMEPIRHLAESRPVWGTCAGAIFLSKDIHRQQLLLGLIDIVVERNAFGRQVASFEIDLAVPALTMEGNGQPRPFHAIFIRAPLIDRVGEGVEVLAKLPDGRIVAARQRHLLATVFHPELTQDDRFHRYFLRLVNTA